MRGASYCLLKIDSDHEIGTEITTRGGQNLSLY